MHNGVKIGIDSYCYPTPHRTPGKEPLGLDLSPLTTFRAPFYSLTANQMKAFNTARLKVEAVTARWITAR
jgi:hypothetical protein